MVASAGGHFRACQLLMTAIWCGRRADDEVAAMRHEQRQMTERLEALAAAEEAAAARVERAQSQAFAQAQRAAAEMEQRLQSKLETTLAEERRCAQFAGMF